MAVPTNRRYLLDLVKSEKWEDAIQAIRSSSNIKDIINVTDSSGQTSLHIAIWKKAPDNLVLLLIDVDETTTMVKSKNRSTPLHFATFYVSSCEVIETLIRKFPMALDEVNEFGVTPRTYDLCKLDGRSREVLMKPTSYWTDVSVKESLEQRTQLRSLLSLRERNLKESRQWNETLSSELETEREAHKILQTTVGELEQKLGAAESHNEMLQKDLESNLSVDVSPRSTTESDEANCDNVMKRKADMPSGSCDSSLERRILYLEQKLSDAILALDKKIELSREPVVVDDGWIITSSDGS